MRTNIADKGALFVFLAICARPLTRTVFGQTDKRIVNCFTGENFTQSFTAVANVVGVHEVCRCCLSLSHRRSKSPLYSATIRSSIKVSAVIVLREFRFV